MPRLRRDLAARIRVGEASHAARVVDMSETGVRLRVDGAPSLEEDCAVTITSGADVPLSLAARPRWREGGGGATEVGLHFLDVDEATHRRIVLLLFTSDEAWSRPEYPRDDPLRSFAYLVSTPWRVARPRRAGTAVGAGAARPLRRPGWRGWREALRA